MEYELRVWKYLTNDSKQLVDMYKSHNLEFMYELLEEYRELYSFWNYEIEKVNF